MDITLLTSQGITPYHAPLVDHGSRPNGMKYKSQFQYYTFNDSGSNLLVRFYVERYFSDGTFDISYTYDAIAASDDYVDKNGNLVSVNDPNKWGSEMDYFRILFNSNVASNKQILEQYQTDLFNRGTFDKPKNPELG